MLGRKMSNAFRPGALLAALDRSLAIIQFDTTGKILAANTNFCSAIGYEASEIIGRHHSMFVEPEYARSADYKAFWKKLSDGEFDAREYKRIGKGGREVWIQASYNPVRNGAGKVVGVVKAATDITEVKLRNAEFEGKLNAISRAQAIIEFETDGTIITANEAFLSTVGYSLEEIRGRGHRMFVDAAYAESPEYADFWRKLNAGEFVAAEFKRFGKNGREVWISASYNPIFDMDGRVMKVVKFATDVTARVNAVQSIGEGLAALAAGQLTRRLETPFPPEYEQLRSDYNSAMETLQQAMRVINDAAHGIRSGTDEISRASDDLARRTEQQAASLEETAAALDQITAAVRTTAEGAKHAQQVVSSTKDEAQQSGEVVREAITAMGEIERSSSEISQIIGVIDEIAFQTNLLALNAGVEAARAGDAGKGFAVVASEVRALAQRSADAAKEIKTLITASTSQVSEGVSLVGRTGSALERIVAQVVEINTAVTEIAASAQEQSTGLQQVNTAVNQMDQATQQNAAMVEQSTAASHSLAQETGEMARLISRFEVGGAPPAPGAQERHPAYGRVVALKSVSTSGRNGGALRKAPEPASSEWEAF
ncbi:PAS domain-containing methyl-accepting chemotaxis protein [Phenylobacterium sp. J426]|uniref:methyl-accepting chemotaxis protein n=1 Tax=Phenylobacterium sp. J426 TaxID=2898439 RepID=UPI0021516CB3|nr:PAS domain-containing methyl-accepting chemotaxis protein [Phenylobacterium sp. J426]MCR5876905.1 PAS domain-containing methyl-accepting chemotaxis protein [Phenylobacterium sp. J426]